MAKRKNKKDYVNYYTEKIEALAAEMFDKFPMFTTHTIKRPEYKIELRKAKPKEKSIYDKLHE